MVASEQTTRACGVGIYEDSRMSNYKNVKVHYGNYSDQTRRRMQMEFAQEIKVAATETPEFRKEISRVFQMANRRIQNLQNASDYAMSPALAALGDRLEKKGYSKFRIGEFKRNEDWDALKAEYGRAVAFLQQPTSTVTGAREFEKAVKENVFKGSEISGDYEDIIWEKIRENVLTGFNDVSPSMLAAMRYTDITQQIYETAVEDTSSIIERLAIQIVDDIDSQLNEEAIRIAIETFDNIDDYLDDILNGFMHL